MQESKVQENKITRKFKWQVNVKCWNLNNNKSKELEFKWQVK